MRLSIHRTPRHIYAQVFDATSRVVAAASTVQKDVAEGLKGTGNVEAAKAVGKAIAERAKAQGVTRVAGYAMMGLYDRHVLMLLAAVALGVRNSSARRRSERRRRFAGNINDGCNASIRGD